MFNRAYAHKQSMEKLHDSQTAGALEKAGNEFDCLVRMASCDELQTALWNMFQESLCKNDDSVMPDDIFIRTEIYDALRHIFQELDRVPCAPDYFFPISYGPKNPPINRNGV